MRLQLRASRYGVEFNEHYLRRNSDGSVTATVFGTKRGFVRLHRAGYDLGTTIEGPATWEDRVAELQRGKRATSRRSRSSGHAGTGPSSTTARRA